MTSPTPFFAFCLLLAAMPLRAAHAQPCTTSWINGAGGSWYTAANWDNGVPGATDDVCITLDGTYTVTVSDFTVNSLTLGAASGTQTLHTPTSNSFHDIDIVTTGTIGANGVLEWNRAFLKSGALTNQGLIRFNDAAVQGATTVLRNEATVEDVGVIISNDARVENASVWDTQGGFAVGSGGVFVNEAGAVFTAQGSGGSSGVFENFGTIDVQSGEFSFSGSSTHTDAVLTTSAGATLHVGDGSLPVVTFAGTVSGNQAGTLRLRSVQFEGGANAVWNFTGNGLLWEQSVQMTAGTLTNQGLVRKGQGSGSVSGAGTVFRNEGTFEHISGLAGGMSLNNGRIENASVWDVTGAVVINGGGTFVNEVGAVLKKSPEPFSHVLARIEGSSLFSFENSGTIDVQAGPLRISVISTHTDAVLNTAAGATLHFMTFVFPSVATFNGTTTGLQDGDLVVEQDFAGGADAVWAFTGNGLTWAGGALTAGTLTSQTPIRIDGAEDKGVDGATALFRSEAPVTHEEGTFVVAGGGRVENASVWAVQGDPDYTGATGTGTFVNEAGATFKKTAGSGATVFADGGLLFDNAGTVSVESGEVDIDRPFAHQAGALIQGTGTVDVAGATFTHGGDTGPGVSPGVLAWEGAYAMGSTATLHIEIVDDAGDGTGHDVLGVAGDADVAQGTLSVTGAPGACTATPPCDYTILTFTGTFTGPFAQEILPPNATVVYPGDPDGLPGEVFVRAAGLLPVELVSFAAVRDGEVVHLRWETASETNNAGFEVQRLTEVAARQAGTEIWQVLGWVEGHGTTVAARRYAFRDAAPPYGPEVVRYRLKQIDYDGTFEYSPDVEVALTPPRSFALSANYPNPFHPQTTIRFALPHASHVRLVVYDMLGREVRRLVEGLTPAGRHEAVFEARGLAGGIYLYQLQAGAFRESRRMVLLN